MTETIARAEQGPEHEAASEIQCDESCPHFRIGLPIVPMRYAIVPSDAPLPELDDNVKAGDPSVQAIAPEAARYGLRLLRSGFLYTFDENLDRLDGYAIDENALLFNLHMGNPAPPLDAFTQPCSLNTHLANASCISIPNARQATRPVWLCYSDVQWTPEVCEAHSDPEVRRRHMVRFDVQAWLNSQQHPGALKVGDVDQYVAEFALYDAEGDSARRVRNALGWSAVPPIQAGWRANGLKYASERLLESANRGRSGSERLQGAVLALPDASGIAQDLAVLMRDRYEGFVSRPQIKRRLAVSTAIEQMEAAVKNQTELSEIQAADELADDQAGRESWLTNQVVDWAFDTDWTEQAEQRVESIRTVTAEELDRAITHEWSQYTEKYDERARAAWQASFDDELRAFDTANIAPLARAHAQWMKSDGMLQNLELNYDTANIHSGAVYTRTVLLCLAGTQDKQACFDTYLEWLNDDDLRDIRNPVLRAMLFNQDNIIDEVQAKLDEGLDPRVLQWPQLIDLYEESVGPLGEGGDSLAARLVEQLMGPLMKALDRVVDSPSVRAVGAALGLMARKAIVPVTETGGRKRFRAALIRQMLKMQSGGEVSTRQIQRAVAAELRRLQARGVSMNGSSRKTWLLLVDPDEIANIPANVSGQERANRLARSLRTPTQFETSEAARWRGVISSDVRLGTVGSVLEAWCLTKLWQEVVQAMPHEQAEAIGRFSAGVLGTIGSTVETSGRFLRNRFATSLRYARMGSAGGVMAKLGGRAAIVAGVVMAAFDFARAWQERQEGNGGMAIAYGLSGAFSIGVIVAFAIGGPVGLTIGLILLALLFAVTVIIELFKDNRFQDWLERCFEWGGLVDQRYQNLESEMQALEAAYEG